jgi:hypothetical protein
MADGGGKACLNLTRLLGLMLCDKELVIHPLDAVRTLFQGSYSPIKLASTLLGLFQSCVCPSPARERPL